MIQAIIFDCFGVIVQESWLPFKQEKFGDKPALLQQVNDWHHLADTGHMDYTDYLERVAAAAAVSVAEIRQVLEETAVNQPLFDYIEHELAPHYKIGMLSNVASDFIERKLSAAQRELFDAIDLSIETGLMKPQPAAYHHIADRLGVEPAACIFTDDQPGYCAAAREQGMQAIEYTGLVEFKRALSEVSS